jgi:outer membrane protein assembly factor BamD
MNFFYLLILVLFLSSCTKNVDKINPIKEQRQDLEIITSYKDAYKALEEGDGYFAAKKFLEAELLLPQSEWASKSALLAAYSFYQNNFYSDAIFNLKRFLITYPEHKDSVYAHYLIAMCYYETIEDEKRDSRPIFLARDEFNLILNKYPETDFALDAKFKLDLIEDLLASKEMYLGRHYIKKEKWIAALNRFKNILDNYSETIFIEEAIHRLVEINYKLGLDEESRKYANLLGYNYLSSEWYKKSYKVFNNDYSELVNYSKNKDKKKVFDIFKKLFD